MSADVPKGSGIYGWQNTVNGKWYVGSAARLRNRRAVHITGLTGGKHYSRKFQRAWAKYGAEAFEFHVLELVEAQTDLLDREQHWIDRLNAFHGGYNSLPKAGSSLGSKRTAETRAKISAIVKKLGGDPAVKARMSRQSTEWMAIPGNREKLGAAIKAAYDAKTPEERAALRELRLKVMSSPATREKIAAKAKGRKPTAATRAKMSAAKRLQKQSPETRAKRSETLKGHPTSPETREKIRQANLGHRLTEEQRERHLAALREAAKRPRKPFSVEARHRMSLAQIGRGKGIPKSAETRQRMKEAAKKRWRGEDGQFA